MDGFYENLFGRAPERKFSPNLDLLDIPNRDRTHLELPFMEDEVERMVKAMPLDKALGPDGFTGRVYSSC